MDIRQSIKVRMSALVAVLLGAFCLFIYFYIPSTLEKASVHLVQDEANSLCRVVAQAVSPALVFDDSIAIEESLDLFNRVPEITYARIVAHSRVHMRGELNPDSTKIYQITVPIRHGPDIIGVLFVQYDLRVQRLLVAESQSNIAIISVFIFLCGLIVIYVISTHIAGPVIAIAKTAERIAAGHKSERVPISSKDEVGLLAFSFNKMVSQLEAAQQELHLANTDLEARVQRRTRDLEAEIAERKQTEHRLKIALAEAAKVEQLKSAFISNMSHEIRTPLNIILGYTSLVEETISDNLTAEQRSYFESIQRGADRLMRTVNDILALSRLETGDVSLDLKATDLKPLLTKLVYDLQPLSEKKGLPLSYHVQENGCFHILGDNHILNQAFTNLIENAIKYTPAGSINVILEERGNDLVVSVKDTGIGISSEYLPKIFDAYTQEAIGFARPFEGIGLGLALVKKYVQLHNGHMEVESTKNVGSTFRVILPKVFVGLKEESRPEVRHESTTSLGKTEDSNEPQATSISSTDKPTILVVDDDKATLEYMNIVLKHDYDVFLASNVPQAMEILQSATITVVITDISLSSDLSGLDLVRMIRSNEVTREIKVIALTAYSKEEAERQSHQSGADRFLRKPVLKKELIEYLRQLTSAPSVLTSLPAASGPSS